MPLYVIHSKKLIKPPFIEENYPDDFEYHSLEYSSRITAVPSVEYTFVAKEYSVFAPTLDGDSTYTIRSKSDLNDVWMEDATLEDFNSLPEPIRSKLALHTKITLDYEVPLDEHNPR